MSLTRRTAISLTGSATLLAVVGDAQARARNFLKNYIRSAGHASTYAVPSDAASDIEHLRITARWAGGVVRAVLENTGTVPVAIKEIVVLDSPHDFPESTGIYGEGFTMLSTTSGTLGTPAWESYRDAVHYRIPEPADALTAYGMVLLSPPHQGHLLIGFLSCKRFVGAINIWPDRVRVGFDAENISIAPGERWVLDPVILVTSADRDAALAASLNVPLASIKPVPTPGCTLDGPPGTLWGKICILTKYSPMRWWLPRVQRCWTTFKSTTATRPRWAIGLMPARILGARWRICAQQSRA